VSLLLNEVGVVIRTDVDGGAGVGVGRMEWMNYGLELG
jgi:hypothetical protein